MQKWIGEFKAALAAEGKAINTIMSYGAAVEEYAKWYRDSFGCDADKLYASNVSDYVSYLRSVKEIRGTSLNPKVAGLKSFNRFLIQAGVQDELVVNDKHRDKVQTLGVSPTDLDQAQVDAFRQRVLVGSGERDHAIVTMLAYAGPRVSEAVNTKLADADSIGREITFIGKGNKVRVVPMSSKIHHAIGDYLKVRHSDSPFLFVNRVGGKLHRSTINKLCSKYSDDIEPHKLRHFFCTRALEVGYSLAEVAYMAGHSNIRTTTGYLHASRKEMIEKADRL